MRSRSGFHHLLWIFPLAVTVVAVACSGATPSNPAAATALAPDPGSTPSSPSVPAGGGGAGGSGTLSVRIKDSPFSEATALVVTFSEVSVHTSGTETTDGEWVTLPFAAGATSRSCDLKRLVTATDVLGTAALTAGHYTQIRLTVSGAKIYATTTTTGDVCTADPVLVSTSTPAEVGINVEVPSGTLKLNREFNVAAAGTTTILLDFDGDKSVHKTGNGKYMMTPVIGVVSVQ